MAIPHPVGPQGRGVKILDTTLREGEQTPTVSFNLEQRIRLFQTLDALGVDMIELGHPGAADMIDKSIAAFSAMPRRAELVLHARPNPSDLRLAYRYPVERVGIFLGTSEIHLERKLRISRAEALRRVREAVTDAVEHGKRVRFAAEDATRTEIEFLKEVCATAQAAGADRLGLPDTVGVATPDQIRTLFAELRAAFPEMGLDAHCHNDLGMGVANSVAAVEGGATCVHVAVNGLGERCGLASLSGVALALWALHRIRTVDLQQLIAVSKQVEEYTGIPVSPQEPGVGAFAFSHKAGLHAQGVIRDPATYEGVSPDWLGREREIVVNRLSGRAVARWALERQGISVTEERLERLLKELKSEKQPVEG